MSSIDLNDPDERAAQVAEYVLGTLDEDASAELERALPNDPALRGELLFWREKLLGLGARVPEAEPTDALWSRIEAGMDGSAPAAFVSQGRPAASATASHAATATRTATPTAVASTAVRWWRRASVWQAVSAVATVACVALASVLIVDGQHTAPSGPRYLAVLQSPGDQRTGWVVEADTGGRLLLVPIGATAAVPAGRALQFWTKARDAAGPTSLGLVAGNQRVDMPVDRLPTLGDAQLFEITLEPDTGSPIGRPTGPILFVGSSFRL
jgi:anti-sigma-K factor RskA